MLSKSSRVDHSVEVTNSQQQGSFLQQWSRVSQNEESLLLGIMWLLRGYIGNPAVILRLSYGNAKRFAA